MWDFFVRVVCVRESVKTQGKLKSKEAFTGSSRVAFLWSEACAQHMTRIRRVVIVGFREWLAGKAFPWDTRETFCFAILSYLLHYFLTHTIYTIITHILRGVLFKEKTLATKPLRVRDYHTHNPLHNPLWFSSTPISPFSNPWEVDSLNTYHIHSECQVRFRCC